MRENRDRLAVTEIALWGRRQQARSSRYAGFLNGVMEAARTVAAGDVPPAALVDHVNRQLMEILDLDACVFDSTVDPSLPSLRPDGTVVTADGRILNVDRSGLPTDSHIQLLAQTGGSVQGEFLLTASTHVARPSIEARRVAVTLAEQVAAAIVTSRPKPSTA